MKDIFKSTMQKLIDSKLFNYIDRDRGQIDHYEERPEVKFPCALIKVNTPQRKNLHASTQQCECGIQIRIAFERLYEQHNLQPSERLEKALAYYDTIETVEALFQGLKLAHTDRWTCVSTADENRNDFEVVKLNFKTTYIKEF